MVELISQDFVLNCENVSMSYGLRKVIDRSSVSIGSGLTVLTAPSGAGKSSVLRMFNRMNDGIASYRIRGSVHYKVDGRVCDLLAPDIDQSALRRKIGFVGQQPKMFPFGIARNIILPLRVVGGLTESEARERMHLCLSLVGLDRELLGRIDEPADDLSVGQKQRLAIARAVALGPEVLLMDEPTSALDPKAKRSVLDAIGEIKERVPVIVSSHDKKSLDHLADSFLEIRGCRLENIL